MQHRAFLDGGGKLRTVTQLPPLLLVEFHGRLTLLLEQIDRTQTAPETLYCSDPFFQQVCDQCLELHNLDPACCTPAIVDRLLFVPGDLVDLNFHNDRPSVSATEKTVSLEQWAAQSVARLMDTEGLVGAIHCCRTIPSDLLSAVLKEHNRMQPGYEESIDDPEYADLLKELDDDLFGLPPLP